MMRTEPRLCTMLAGWMLAFYGVWRRDWPGTIMAMTGLGLAGAALTMGLGEVEEQR